MALGTLLALGPSRAHAIRKAPALHPDAFGSAQAIPSFSTFVTDKIGLSGAEGPTTDAASVLRHDPLGALCALAVKLLYSAIRSPLLALGRGLALAPRLAAMMQLIFRSITGLAFNKSEAIFDSSGWN
ncbi:MAG: hypothetical protein JSS84_01805 [Bacteroidetes bacterium]|nr:hypothetical protein [Bacteroidota bacterium]